VVLFDVFLLVEHLPLHEVVTLGEVKTDSISFYVFHSASFKVVLLQ
jgi:hypothetical protein